MPQGPVLGPRLCLLDINNIQRAGLKGTYPFFADDTVIMYHGKTKKLLQSDIDQDMIILEN